MLIGIIINSNRMDSSGGRGPSSWFAQHRQDVLVVGGQRARRWLIEVGISSVHRTRESKSIIHRSSWRSSSTFIVLEWAKIER